MVPAQLQFQGPEPVTLAAVPELQRPSVGATAIVVPLADPQAPLVATVAIVFCAEHWAVVPPFEPVQLQAKGPEPVTLDEVPVVQRLEVGAVDTVVPLDEPQAPFTAVAVTILLAEH